MADAFITRRGGEKPKILTGITIISPPTKTSYHQGDALDLSGMVVTATYYSGETEVVTGYTTSPAAGSTLDTKGTVTVTVSYTENDTTKTASFAVSVTMKIVQWSTGTDAEIVEMVAAADRGEINLSDYWAVGDIRRVALAAMPKTGLIESHYAQEVDFVLMHAGGYNLNTAVASGRTKCSFIVGMKDSLVTNGYMNWAQTYETATNEGSWEGSERRAWCNSTFRNSIPSSFRGIFKQFKTVTAKTYNGTTNQTSIDYFSFPAAKEVFGGSATSAGKATSYSNLTEFKALFQFDWYKTASNRKKRNGASTTGTYPWWERSPDYDDIKSFCGVNPNAEAVTIYAHMGKGISPFGCI